MARKVFIFLSVLFVSFVLAKADFLNDYLNTKVFGADPGPCPNEANKCETELDPNRLNPLVANIEVCLIQDYCVLEIIGCVIGPFTICAPIKDWIKGGHVEIWDLQCTNVGVTALNLRTLSSSSTEVVAQAFADNIQQSCNGEMYFTDVEISFGDLGAIVSGGSLFYTNSPSSGTNLDFQFILSASDFNEEIPQEIQIPVEDCIINIGANLELDVLNGNKFDKFILCIGFLGCNLSVAFLDAEGLTNILVAAFEAAFGGVMCDILAQSTTTLDNQPGILNIELDEFNEFFNNISQGTPDDVLAIDANPLGTFGYLSSTDLQNSMDFSDDDLIEIVSVGLNDWLGQVDPNSGRLVVNDVIEQLLGNEDGEFNIDLVNEGIILEDTIPLQITNVTIKLTEFNIQGLDTITAFNLMENNYDQGSVPADRMKYTLNHTMFVDGITFLMDIDINLARGDWVTYSPECGSIPIIDCDLDSVQLSFQFGLTLSVVKMTASIFSAFQPDLLDDVQVGQILGRDFRSDPLEALRETSRCLAPAFHALFFSSLGLSIDEIFDPVSIIPDSSGLAVLITNTINLVNDVGKSAFRLAAPGIFQGSVRPSLNEFLKDEVVLIANLDNCEDYIPGQIPADELYLNFETGTFSNIYPVINDVLGNFDPLSSTDMNDLIQVILEYYSAQVDDFPLQPQTNAADEVIPGFWETKGQFNDTIFIEAFRGNGLYPGDAFINAFNFKIQDLDTIYTLNAEYFGNTQNGLSMDFSFGEKNGFDQPLVLSMDWRVKVDNPPVDRTITQMDELFTFNIILGGIDVELDLDQILMNIDYIYQLRFGQLQTTPCLLSVLEGIAVVKTLVNSSKIFAEVEVNGMNPNDASPPGGSNYFQESLFYLQKATLGVDPSRQFKAMVNTILDNGFADTMKSIEEFDTSVTPATCDNADDPLGSIVGSFTGFELPNITGTVAVCIADPTETPLNPLAAEAEVIGIFDNVTYFSFQDSIIVDQLQGEFGTNQDDATRNGILQDIVFLLANQSGTPLTDAFYLEEIDDGSGGLVEAVTLYLKLNESNFLFDLFDIDPLVYTDDTIIPGMEFEFIDITIKGIDRFVSKSKFLDVLSDFVTGYAFGFTEANPLLVTINGAFEADGEFVGDAGGPRIREDFELDFVVSGLDLEFEFLAAINTGIFQNLTLGHFFGVSAGNQDFYIAETATRCLFSCFFENGVSIPRLNMSVSELDGPNLRTSQNILSVEVEDMLDSSLKLLRDFYIDAIPNIAYNCMRTYFNDILREKWEEGQNGACPTDPAIEELPRKDQLFRFGSSEGIRRFNDFVQENFINGDPKFQLWNDIMESLTMDGNNLKPLYTEEGLGFEDAELVYNGVGYGQLTVEITDLTIENFDTFSRLDIVVPITDEDNFTTVNAIRIDGPTVFDFNLDIIAKNVFKDTPLLVNNLRVKMTLQNVNLGLEVYAVINVTEALHIRFSSVSDLNQLPCLLVPVDALRPNDFNMSTDSLALEISCRDKCEFPQFESLANGGTIISDPEDDLSSLVNDAIAFFVDYVEGTGAQGLIDAQLETAEETCAEILGILSGLLDIESTDDADIALFMGYGFLSFMGVFSIGTMLLLPYHKKRRKKAIEDFVASKKTLEKEKEILMFQTAMQSLFAHPGTNIVAKFAIPFVCIVNIFGLVIAVVFSGAINIILTFVVFGAETNNIVLVPFTIATTINDLWNSGAVMLSLLVAVASVAWPIIKNLLLIIIWLSPTTILDKQKRNKYLLIMDILGKWSFLDVFVVVMTLAALRTYLRLSMYSRVAFLDDDTFEVDVNVTPERGIVLLCFVAASSLIVNHIISWYHEKAARYDQAQEDELRGIITTAPRRAAQRMKMKDHKFAGIDRKGRRKVISKKAFTNLTVINMISGACVLVGVFVPFVTFELGGLIGLLIGQINEPLTVKTYSIADLGALVSESPTLNGLDTFIIIFFQVLFFLTSLVFPIAQVVVNLGMFLLPMSLKDMSTYLWFAWIVSFWAALECFLVGILMTLLQIDTITIYILDFISDDLCSNIQGVLETLLGPQDGQCLTVEGYFMPLAPALFIGVVLQLGVSVVTLQTAEAVINDRYYQSYNGVRKETKPPKQSRLKKFVLKQMTKPVRMARGKAQANPNKTDSLQLDSVRLPPAASGSPSVASNPMFNGTTEVEEDIEV